MKILESIENKRLIKSLHKFNNDSKEFEEIINKGEF